MRRLVALPLLDVRAFAEPLLSTHEDHATTSLTAVEKRVDVLQVEEASEGRANPGNA